VAADSKIAVGSSAEATRRRRGAILFFWTIATLAVFVGILDTHDVSTHASWKNLHPLFGLLLLAYVISRFYWRPRNSPSVRPPDLRAFSRQVSRSVLLLLYVVIFAREIMGLVGLTWHDGAFDFPLLKAYLSMSISRRGGELRSDLSGYLACGIVALAMVRLLAECCRQFAKHGLNGEPRRQSL
jgi:cytochrome b561